jgi:hypothetical protein
VYDTFEDVLGYIPKLIKHNAGTDLIEGARWYAFGESEPAGDREKQIGNYYKARDQASEAGILPMSHTLTMDKPYGQNEYLKNSVAAMANVAAVVFKMASSRYPGPRPDDPYQRAHRLHYQGIIAQVFGMTSEVVDKWLGTDPSGGGIYTETEHFDHTVRTFNAPREAGPLWNHWPGDDLGMADFNKQLAEHAAQAAQMFQGDIAAISRKDYVNAITREYNSLNDEALAQAESDLSHRYMYEAQQAAAGGGDE